MRRVASTFAVNNEFKDFQAGTRNGTVYPSRWLNDVQRELLGIQTAAGVSEGAGSDGRVLASIKKIWMDERRKPGTEYSGLVYREPAAFDVGDLDAYFNGICLDAIDGSQDFSDSNWPDLVPAMRSVILESGATTDFDCVVVGNEIYLADETPEADLLTLLASWQVSFGTYVNWITVTINSVEYDVVNINAATRVITVAGSPSQGSETMRCYPHRVSGSTTTARLYQPLDALGSAPGETWDVQTPITSSQINGVHYNPSSGLFRTVGDVGEIYRSSDGINWSADTSGTSMPLYGIFGATGAIYAVGLGGTARVWTGSAWIDYTAISGATSENLYAVVRGSQVYAVGSGDKFIKGNSEVTVGIGGTIYCLHRILHPSGTGTRLICAGYNGRVAYSDDLGSTWVIIQLPTTDNLVGIAHTDGLFGINPGSVIVVGNNGSIYRSTDFGENWQAVTSGTSENLYSVCMARYRAIAVGDNGTILTSTDDGQTWTAQTSGSTEDLRAVAASDELAVAVGTNGEIVISSGEYSIKPAPEQFRYVHGGRYIP